MFRFDKVSIAVQMSLGFELLWFIPELGVIVNSPQVWNNLLYKNELGRYWRNFRHTKIAVSTKLKHRSSQSELSVSILTTHLEKSCLFSVYRFSQTFSKHTDLSNHHHCAFLSKNKVRPAKCGHDSASCKTWVGWFYLKQTESPGKHFGKYLIKT